jgi:hypothetical protein
MLLEMRRSLGYDAYITQETFDILAKVFTEESILIPVLERTFCNVDQMKFQVFDGNFTHLIMPDTKYNRGRMLNLFPPDPENKRAFKPQLSRHYSKFSGSFYRYIIFVIGWSRVCANCELYIISNFKFQNQFFLICKLNGMSSIGYLGRFFETARTAW